VKKNGKIMELKNAYLVGGLRSPIGNFTGTLSSVRADDLAAQVLAALKIKYSNINFSEVHDVIMGCANQAGEDNRNIARMASLLASYPVEVPGITVNRLCASGLSASMDAARNIMTGDADLMVAGGIEHMTRSPWVMSKSSSPFGKDVQLYDSSFGWRFINPKMKEMYGVDAMGETAENLAAMYSISREDQDAFALRSQQKATKAREQGRFKMEIAPIQVPQKKGDDIIFSEDEFIKPATSMEGLSKLKPAFRKEGSVAAGNASGLNDGAAALLLASETALKKYDIKPLAKFVSMGVVGLKPNIMGFGPVEASNMALKKAGLSMMDMDVIELNEAFAAQSLACIRAWGLSDDDVRINPNGGAIALGHPLGMSGARILLSAALELQIQKKKYALVTMCIGVGQGYAVIIENAQLN
jgi:acetyl-CoA acyltransferase